METKNKIVRYSESFRTDSEIKEPWHYKSMERTVDGVYVVPEIYLPLHRSFQNIRIAGLRMVPQGMKRKENF